MDYNTEHSTRTAYHTAQTKWSSQHNSSVCVVESVISQRIVSSASDSNLGSTFLRERFQQTRNAGSESHFDKSQDSWTSGWPAGTDDTGHPINACGLIGHMQRKWSSNLGHYGSKLYGFAKSGLFTKDQLNHGLKHNTRRDDFEIIEKYELSSMKDDPLFSTVNGFRPGVGHKFVTANLRSSTWCDKCGDFIWGIYKKCVVCINCRYTCHMKCLPSVTLDCIVTADGVSQSGEPAEETDETCFSDEMTEFDSEDESGYHTCSSASFKSYQMPAKGEMTLARDSLKQRIGTFNLNNHGLQMIMEMPEAKNTFQGSVRVHMNLIRPINMSVSPSPPSLYAALTHEMENEAIKENSSEKVMSFYLPRNTSKVIHISSSTTAQEVIRALLSKFSIADNPRKFALYEKNMGHKKTGVMRKMAEDELPLMICLGWTDGGIDQLDSNIFILQENDTGEIMWDEFSLPELANFLGVLNREEEEHIDQVKDKYRLFRIQLQKEKELRQKEPKQEETERRLPVFV